MLLRTCADLYSDKVNLEIPFEAAWGVDRLRDVISGVMDREGDLMRPPNAPRIPFQLNQLQVFDDRVHSWVDVVSVDQLEDGSQLYAFQPQTHYHRDVQKDFPPSRPPSQPGQMPHRGAVSRPSTGLMYSQPRVAESMATGATQPGLGVAYENGRDGASLEEKLAYLFDEMDYHEKGQVSYQDFASWMRELVDFPEEEFRLLFHSGDVNRQGFLTRETFNCFSRRFPNVCEIVFHRAADRWDVTNRDVEARTASQQLQSNQGQEKDLEQQLEGLQAQVRMLTHQLGCLQSENVELQRTIQHNTDLNKSVAQRRSSMLREEHELMEKEINMERHREALRDSEQMFLEQSQRYDRAACALGSPRRSRHYSTQ